MRAVILAAGRGGRLKGVVGNRPKCLARVGNSTLIERQSEILRHAGLTTITVIVGYQAGEVLRVCGPDVSAVANVRYASTNSLYSLWLARHLLTEGFVVLNCDVLFHPQLLDDLLMCRYDDALLACARGRDGAYSDEEMKISIRRGLVAAIHKGLGDDVSDAENIGIAKFSESGAAVLVEALDGLIAAGEVRAWLPRAFADFSHRRPLHVVDSRGLPWTEIDTPEDYWHACADVLPAIDSAGITTAPAVGTAPLAPLAAASGRTIHHV